MLTKHDETLIQRCVDGELTTEERRELLTRVEQQPEGWKVLACSFMEDRLFADAAVEAAGGGIQTTLTWKAPASTSANKRSWFYHPVTSVALSLCVAFLVGLLASGGLRPSQEVSVTERKSAGSTVANKSLPRPSDVTGSLVSAKPDYSVRFEADGMFPRELPVYDDPAAFLSSFEAHQIQMHKAPHRNTDKSVRSESQLHFLRIQMDDGRTIVVPFEGHAPRFQ